MWGSGSETYIYMHCIDTRDHLQKMEGGWRRSSFVPRLSPLRRVSLGTRLEEEWVVFNMEM